MLGCLVGEAKKKKVVVEWFEYERKSEAKHGLMFCWRSWWWKRRVCEGEDDKNSGE